jgi:hypothetical protein
MPVRRAGRQATLLMLRKTGLLESERMVNVDAMTIMTLPDPGNLATTLLTAPAWCRVGLTAPTQRLRELAAAELAQAILGALDRPAPAYDARQMALPL